MTESSHCPLCGGLAQFEWRDNRHRKLFDCPTCGRFKLTTAAERRLAQAPRDWREQLSLLSQQSTEHRILLITRSHPFTPTVPLQTAWIDLDTCR